ncbi:trehalose 6-phosphate synthase [Nonomuraea thailandensis]|uniref:Trehalose 6-phosphate synthase n=1 Tax=Nonomuraea thailandensis TaxID=1188745 RepID=A0A9X2GFZ5_9ACTN|nr:trehalose-6-phosphate synthase [Nonomuraea thailandensis]MCP2357857.1 trehalose 6-phosphate synthase [Nonomuraea thailandensis]
MKLLTCSNTCPRWDAGTLRPRSPGGLAPMLVALLNEHGGDWVFTAPPEDSTPARLAGGIRLHPIELPEDVRHHHYDVISIRLLLGLLHYMHDTSAEPVFDGDLLESWAAYEAVNQAYAKRLGELATGGADEHVLINDPHLMLVPEYFDAEPGDRRGRMTYFLGTPWVEPDYYGILPGRLRTRVLESLLRCDVVGFHCDRWAEAFLACCARFLPGVRVEGRTVTGGGHTTRVVSVPFPVDHDVLERMRHEPATARWAGRLAELAAGRRTLVRADRLDLWKNLPRGFLAYETMLLRRPELAARCWFAAVVTTPSRAAERHLDYQRRTEAIVERINARFGAPGRQAATLIYPGPGDDSRNCVVAALGTSRAALVNSTYDGLNLFAKEAAYLLPDDGTLLISENAGVHQQLGPYAGTLDPFDPHQMSVAIEQALDGGAPPAGLAVARRELLRRESPQAWLRAVFPG